MTYWYAHVAYALGLLVLLDGTIGHIKMVMHDHRTQQMLWAVFVYMCVNLGIVALACATIVNTYAAWVVALLLYGIGIMLFATISGCASIIKWRFVRILWRSLIVFVGSVPVLAAVTVVFV